MRCSPDFDLFEVNSLEELDTITLIEDRLISLQMAFPEIQFSFNKKKVMMISRKEMKMALNLVFTITTWDLRPTKKNIRKSEEYSINIRLR